MTLSIVDFMRISLAEIYVLNTDIAYKQAFINIRQLAVLLRSALTNTTQKVFLTVLNMKIERLYDK